MYPDDISVATFRWLEINRILSLLVSLRLINDKESTEQIDKRIILITIFNGKETPKAYRCDLNADQLTLMCFVDTCRKYNENTRDVNMTSTPALEINDLTSQGKIKACK